MLHPVDMRSPFVAADRCAERQLRRDAVERTLFEPIDAFAQRQDFLAAKMADQFSEEMFEPVLGHGLNPDV